MGLYEKFDVIDDFHYTSETPFFKIKPDYSEGCKVFVETFLRVSQSLVPVDTGYLYSTLTASQLNETSCEAMADCEYAQYVEYGTWKQKAQPYFEPAYEAALSAAQFLWDLEEARIWDLEYDAGDQFRDAGKKMKRQVKRLGPHGGSIMLPGGVILNASGIGRIAAAFLAGIFIAFCEAIALIVYDNDETSGQVHREY